MGTTGDIDANPGTTKRTARSLVDEPYATNPSQAWRPEQRSLGPAVVEVSPSPAGDLWPTHDDFSEPARCVHRWPLGTLVPTSDERGSNNVFS
jgi:hypothetical protein